MADREKVIKNLQSVANICALNGDIQSMTTIGDALALLKEQEEGVVPIISTTEQKKFADRIGFAVSEFWCGKCHFNLIGRPKFCPNCGKKVKWDG
ncbi:MAG: hypothetical protein J5938_05915 [Clostridia bacterium]|nr:hypothetical protein [Clostridia bacterium]